MERANETAVQSLGFITHEYSPGLYIYNKTGNCTDIVTLKSFRVTIVAV